MSPSEILRTIPNGAMGLLPSMIVGRCAVGCDIRPGSWDVAIGDVVLGSKGLRVPRLVFYGKVRDDEDVEALADQYRAVGGVSDSRPDATLAERLQGRMRKKGMRWWRANYNTAPSDVKMQENVGEGILKLERTMTLDDVHWGFLTGIGIALPQNFREIAGGDFAKEMTSSTRVPTRWHGQEWNRWADQGPDHAFHAINYMLVAMAKIGLAAWGSGEIVGATPGYMRGAKAAQSAPSVTDAVKEDEEEDEEELLTWTA